MALRDFQVARKEVLAQGTSFSVRGLSFSDFSILFQAHRQDFEAVADLARAGTAESVSSLLGELAARFPLVAAHAISLAADEPDAIAVVLSLPAPVVLDALISVAELTFVDPGAVPKFLAQLTRAMQGASQALPTA